jgi:hypothetical protein
LLVNTIQLGGTQGTTSDYLLLLNDPVVIMNRCPES